MKMERRKEIRIPMQIPVDFLESGGDSKAPLAELNLARYRGAAVGKAGAQSEGGMFESGHAVTPLPAACRRR